MSDHIVQCNCPRPEMSALLQHQAHSRRAQQPEAQQAGLAPGLARPRSALHCRHGSRCAVPTPLLPCLVKGGVAFAGVSLPLRKHGSAALWILQARQYARAVCMRCCCMFAGSSLSDKCLATALLALRNPSWLENWRRGGAGFCRGGSGANSWDRTHHPGKCHCCGPCGLSGSEVCI